MQQRADSVGVKRPGGPGTAREKTIRGGAARPQGKAGRRMGTVVRGQVVPETALLLRSRRLPAVAGGAGDQWIAGREPEDGPRSSSFMCFDT